LTERRKQGFHDVAARSKNNEQSGHQWPADWRAIVRCNPIPNWIRLRRLLAVLDLAVPMDDKQQRENTLTLPLRV
jgi:hypothetical protein